MPLIGELKDRVTFLEPQYGTERTGQEQVKHVDRFDAWAKVEGATSRDVMRSRQVGVDIQGQLTIRIATRLADDWQVRVGAGCDLPAGVYTIKSISHVDRRWSIVGVRRFEP